MPVNYARNTRKRREKPAIAADVAPNRAVAPLALAGFEAEGDAVGFETDAVPFDALFAEADAVATAEEFPGSVAPVKAGLGGNDPPVPVSKFVGLGIIGTIVEAVETWIGFPVAEGVGS